MLKKYYCSIKKRSLKLMPVKTANLVTNLQCIGNEGASTLPTFRCKALPADPPSVSSSSGAHLREAPGEMTWTLGGVVKQRSSRYTKVK